MRDLLQAGLRHAARSCTACMQFSKDCMPGRLNNLKVEEKLVHIAKGGTRSPEYREVNPLGKLPCLQVLHTSSYLSMEMAQALAGHTALTLQSPMPMDVQEGTFVLPESASILRYLATTKEVPDHWYPSKACLPCIL